MGPPSFVGGHCAEHGSPPYLGLGQSCPSFLPGAWSPADSCNSRGLPVWPAPYWTSAPRPFFLPPFHGAQGREGKSFAGLCCLSRGPYSHWERLWPPQRSDPLPADLSSSDRGQMVGRAGAGHPPLLLDPGQLWGIAADGIPGSWQARVGTLPAREEVAVLWAKREAAYSCKTRVTYPSSKVFITCLTVWQAQDPGVDLRCRLFGGHMSLKQFN